MVRLRFHGEKAEIEEFVELICNNMPTVRVLQVSKPYKDRGASVYERCYMDVELNQIAEVAEEVKPKQITDGEH